MEDVRFYCLFLEEYFEHPNDSIFNNTEKIVKAIRVRSKLLVHRCDEYQHQFTSFEFMGEYREWY
jgi:hypothetical protein